jgi:VWFA-related protein
MGDFTVLVDDQVQPLVAFSEVEIPVAEVPTADWMRDVAPDVKGNDLTEPRLFVMVLDDALVGSSPFTINATKAIARGVIDRLGPKDLACIVFTGNNRNAQDFTADRTKLLAAVERFNFTLTAGLGAKYSTHTLSRALEYLQQVPERRSSIIYVSNGPDLDLTDLDPTVRWGLDGNISMREDAQAVYRQLVDISGRAHIGNVRIYGVSPAGLTAPGDAATPTLPIMDSVDVARRRNDFLHTVSNNSGARAIVDTNDPAGQVDRIFRENSVYYVLGYKATYSTDDGRSRRLRIRLNRDDVSILPSERKFDAPRRPKKTKTAPPAVTSALAGILPKSDVPLRVSVAPFSVPARASGSAPATVLVALGVQPRVAPDGSLRPDSVEIETRVFDGEGRKQIDVRRHTAQLTPRSEQAAPYYDILSRLDLKPGRYNLRFATERRSDGKTGSVYTDIVVPDFAKAPLSMSGVAIEAVPGALPGAKEVVAPILPVLPTTRREFADTDRVAAFVRIYQGGKKEPSEATLALKVIDSRDSVTFERVDALDASRFAQSRAADYRFELPMDRIPPGSYVLTLEASLGVGPAVRRDVRFNVR